MQSVLSRKETIPDSAVSYLRAALAGLSAPPSLLAIAVLLANDHYLKARYPSWITGKLSDFAGLYFAPFVVLVAVFAGLGLVDRWRGDRGRANSSARQPRAHHAAVGVFLAVAALFVALKVSSATASLVLEAVRLVTSLQLAVVADRSDLIALAIVTLAYVTWRGKLAAAGRPAGRRAGWHCRLGPGLRTAARIGVVFGAAGAMVATSPPIVPKVVGIAVDPQNPKLVYAVRSDGRSMETLTPYRSEDGGDSWRPMALAASRVIPDPVRPGRVYIYSANALQRLVEGSTAAETIWKPDAELLSGLNMVDWDKVAIEVPADGAGVIYVGVTGAVLRSLDAGDTWTKLPLPGASERIVTAIATSPAARGSVWAVLDGQLYFSGDRGGNWTAVSTLVELSSAEKPPYALAVQAENRDLLIAGNYDGLYRSIDGGRTWREVWTDRPAKPNPSVKPAPPSYWGREWRIRFDAKDQRVVYVANPAHALLVSRDAGETWQTFVDKAVYDVAVAPSSGRGVFLAAGENGVYRQVSELKPKGKGWEKANSGLEIK